MMRTWIVVALFFTCILMAFSCTSNPFLGLGESSHLSGSLSGYVYQLDGKTPISGINMHIYIQEEFVSRELTTDVTDINGKYFFNGLLPGRYSVYPSSTPGYRLIGGPIIGTVYSVSSGETTWVDDFKMQVLCSISGRVFDEANNMGIANAEVCAGGSANYVIDGCLNATTAADGSYKIIDLAPGYATLKVMADGYVPRYYGGIYNWRDAATVITRSGENTQDINIGLEKGGSISGRVYQPDGTTPAANIPVFWQQILKNTTDVETPDPRVGGPLPAISVLTNGEGDYIIEGLLTGEYLLMALTDQRASYDSITETVKIGQLTPGANLKLVVCGSLSGHVYKSDTKIPVGQGEVYVHVLKNDSSYGSQGMTRQDGSYLIEKLPAGEYNVNIDVFRGCIGPLSKQYTAKITSGQNTTLDIIVPAY